MKFYGVCGNGRLIVKDSVPYCLTTYKPAAEAAITDSYGHGLGMLARSHGTLTVEEFTVAKKKKPKGKKDKGYKGK